MTATHEHVPATLSPYIDRVYLEKDFTRAGRATGILVIETNIALRDIKPGTSDDERLNELLLDLSNVQALAETQVGHFERIDIRSTH